MELQLDINLGVKAQGPQGEPGKIYKPYVAEDGNLHASLINPDGSPVQSFGNI